MSKFRYDPEVDALALHMTDKKIVDTHELETGILVDLDAQGKIVGVEILDLQERLNKPRAKTTSAISK
jgi:uncharacterized protein YuzE